MIEQFINALGTIIMDDLKENGISFFIGGSRRFGYNNKNSDLDIYVCLSNGPQLRDYIMKLKQSGFDHGETHLYVEIPYNFKDMVHIIIMNNRVRFDLLSSEHDELELHINSYPLLRAVALALKRNCVDGTKIYRTLLTIMEADKPQKEGVIWV
jgi:hypothetical protein